MVLLWWYGSTYFKNFHIRQFLPPNILLTALHLFICLIFLLELLGGFAVAIDKHKHPSILIQMQTNRHLNGPIMMTTKCCNVDGMFFFFFFNGRNSSIYFPEQSRMLKGKDAVWNGKTLHLKKYKENEAKSKHFLRASFQSLVFLWNIRWMQMSLILYYLIQ